MKRRDLELHLRAHGCKFVRHGSNHDLWVNAPATAQTSIPRHNEIKSGLARNICKDLGIPQPTKR